MLLFFNIDWSKFFKDNETLAPKNVHIVLSPSGEIKTKLFDVFLFKKLFSQDKKCIPKSFRSFLKLKPKLSFATEPKKSDFPPKDEYPTAVLAALPPDFILYLLNVF